jgi:hypothetical protein
MANRHDAELLAVFVETPDWASATARRRHTLEDDLRLNYQREHHLFPSMPCAEHPADPYLFQAAYDVAARGDRYG